MSIFKIEESRDKQSFLVTCTRRNETFRDTSPEEAFKKAAEFYEKRLKNAEITHKEMTERVNEYCEREFTPENLLLIAEFALVSMSDEVIFNQTVEKMDIEDEIMLNLRDKLRDFLNPGN